MDLLAELKKNPFVLAPMAGITDCAFRSFMREMGCGVVITELVSATGLKYSSEKTRRIMQFNANQHPVGVQLFGEDLDDLANAAKEVEQMGADFVDLNFGCPVPKVVKKGAGSAVLKDLVYLRSVLRATKSAVKIPVTDYKRKDASSINEGGFAGKINGGVRFFRTSDTQMEVLATYMGVFSAHNPGVYGVEIRVLF